MPSEKKQKFEDTKKTVKAYETLSEKKATEKAKNAEEVSKKLIEKKEILPEKEAEKKEVIKKEGGRGKTREEILSDWSPKTKLGQDVKNGKIKSIDEILEKRKKILEPEIVDTLIEVKSDLVSVGQFKGKFGGGKRRAWRQTQRKTKEGNIPTFSTMAVIGDEDGHVGIGEGRSKETLPARDKAIRKAKLGIIKVGRTCAGFDCACKEPHTVPFKITGKAGSVRVTLIPAAQGTGLVVANELKKVLKLAGIKDVYSRTTGKKRTTFNLIKGCMDALNKTRKFK
jgi:small subunit ribosomal protein S5